MEQAAGCRILAVMGSGETSPTMVTTHKALVARLPAGRRAAVLLEAPYGFQENAAGVSARAQAYFARSVGLTVTVLAAPAGRGSGDPAGDEDADAVRSADWVFAGPGSPSYALAQWRGSPLAAALLDRVAAGEGVTVFASAAAATMGFAAVPVYEIYKAGAAPHWLDGLDLLGILGLKVAVIPHYDNAEGGSYDTRYCYLGERRLSLLERELPADAAVLGVDEHTAAVFDLRAGTVEISGRGGVTVRRAGTGIVLTPGTVLALARLRELVRGEPAAGGGPVSGIVASPSPPWPSSPASSSPASSSAPAASSSRSAPPASPPPASPPGAAAPPGAAGPPADPPLSLAEIARAAERSFGAAAGDRQASGMVQAILDLETEIQAWAADTDEDQGTGQATVVLRGLVTRLGQAAAAGLNDPRDRLLPAVQPLIALRADLRGRGCYLEADAIRDALAAAGLQLHDTPDGTAWTP
jgi:cyanophycinase-like exopeptidase